MDKLIKEILYGLNSIRINHIEQLKTSDTIHSDIWDTDNNIFEFYDVALSEVRYSNGLLVLICNGTREKNYSIRYTINIKHILRIKDVDSKTDKYDIEDFDDFMYSLYQCTSRILESNIWNYEMESSNYIIMEETHD